MFVLLPGLQADLRAEQEKVKEKDQKRRDLEETVDVLRKELNKTEQARKDASIKVRSRRLQDVINSPILTVYSFIKHHPYFTSFISITV